MEGSAGYFPNWSEVAPGVERGEGNVYPSTNGGNVQLLVNPHEKVVQIGVRGNVKQPNVGGRANLTVGAASDGSSDWTFLSVNDLRIEDIEDAYAFVSVIGNEIENEGLPFAEATARALTSFGHILAKSGRLSAEVEVGLIGELLFLRQLIQRSNVEDALQSWIGPNGGAHDFEIDGTSFEVKATRSAERKHQITSEFQLEPTLNAELRLVSIQMVRAAGVGSWGLPALVEELEVTCREHLNDFRDKLENVGWRPHFAEAAFGTWKLSAKALEFVVDHDFPRITASSIGEMSARPELISDVSYVLHLDQYQESPAIVVSDDFGI